MDKAILTKMSGVYVTYEADVEKDNDLQWHWYGPLKCLCRIFVLFVWYQR